MNGLADEIGALVASEVNQFVTLLTDMDDDHDVFSVVEDMARDLGQRISQALIQASVDSAGVCDVGPSTPCGCGHQARRVQVRGKTIATMTGPIRVSRTWYHCDQCHGGFAPLDGRLGVGATMSPALVKACTLTGMEMPFARGVDFIGQVTGISLRSAKTVDRVTRRVGQDAQTRLEAEAQAVKAHRLIGLPPAGVNVGYVAMDGTGAPMVPSETVGRPGKGPDGRAHTREVKLATLFTQTCFDTDGQPIIDEGSASYVSTFHDVEGFKTDVGVEVIRRGFNQLRRIVILGDGAKWIWGLADTLFPNQPQIVDWYHGAEHVHRLADIVETTLDDKATWVQARLNDLEAGNTQAIKTAVALLNLPSHTARQAGIEVDYFITNHHRMQYAHFKKKGYFIGSGAVEGSCKSIVAQRAKQAGMRWTIAGLAPILTLRALHRTTNRDPLIWDKNPSQTTLPTAA